MDRIRFPGRRLFDYRGETPAITAAADRLLAAIARVTATDADDPHLLIGWDGSAPAGQVAEHLAAQVPATVLELTSPAVYRLSRGYTLGVAVTASHDSAAGVTGLKVAQDGAPWVADDYDQLDATGTFLQPLRAAGMDAGRDEAHAYRRQITSGVGPYFVEFARPIAVIGGSAPATRLGAQILADLGLTVTARTVDGLDPSQPDPPVSEPDAILLDADGDRLGIVWQGSWRSPAEITMADIGTIARVLGTAIGGILFDLRTPTPVLAAARAHGFQADFGPGGRWMNLAVSTPRYVYGAEVSGHRYWGAFSGSDCAVFGALKTLSHYIAADPAGPLIDRPPDPVEQRTVSAAVLAAARRRAKAQDWTLYDLPHDLGWRAETADEQHWICGRTASDGHGALAAVGRGVELFA